MTIAISRAQSSLDEPTSMKAFVVNPSGDQIFIGHLIQRPEGEGSVEYRLAEGEVYIYVYEGLYGCFFDRVFNDRFEVQDTNNI